jgi:hypothetical protein
MTVRISMMTEKENNKATDEQEGVYGVADGVAHELAQGALILLPGVHHGFEAPAEDILFGPR